MMKKDILTATCIMIAGVLLFAALLLLSLPNMNS
jgi:hypothetical protein